MKSACKFILAVYALILLCTVASPIATQHAYADTTNLIANSSLETASGTAPQSWTKDSWGTITATQTYDTTGHTGSRSVTTKVTKYTSGDAKWDFAHVTVTAGASYTYSDYYKSTVQTQIVAEFINTDGSYTYQDVGTAVASASAWAQYSGAFTVPAGAKTVSVFHIIAAVGTLTIDDASLTTATITPPTDPTPPTPQATGTNLIANPSMESASGTLPQSWTKDTWGTITATLTYDATGHTGSRSVTAKVTKYTSGDAKWVAAPVAVTAGSTYTFSDYYKATVVTDVVAQYDDGAGNYAYADLGTPPASTAWAQYQVAVVIPAGVKNVSILHLIAKVGTLTIDDASLALPATTPPTPTLVPNPSLELSTANQPQNWYQGGWGSNTTSFSYDTTGHTGSRSVGITMSNFVDGGANWTYDAPVITAGKQYVFSNYYQSNVATQVLAAVRLTDGMTQYVWLANAVPSDGAWTKFSTTFTMPANAVTAVVYQSIAGNGYLKVDDFSLDPYVLESFSAPLVTITFDDSIASQYTNGLPVLQKYGLNGTFYAITGDIDVCDPDVSSICYMTRDQLKALSTAGNEIGSHTVTHPDLTTLTHDQIVSEMSQSKSTLEQWLGKSVTDFAAPYGHINGEVQADSQQYYTSQRGVQIGYNSIDNYNQQDLLVQDINSTTTVAQVKSYIDQAKATNTWLILMYHDINVDDTTDPGYNTTPADFDQQMAYLKASGISVQTMAQALQTVNQQTK